LGARNAAGEAGANCLILDEGVGPLVWIDATGDRNEDISPCAGIGRMKYAGVRSDTAAKSRNPASNPFAQDRSRCPPDTLIA
jgi:hypothetical protein